MDYKNNTTKMADIIFDESELDINFSKYEISSYYENMFYEIFTINHWIIIKEIDNSGITFENNIKIKFEVELIDNNYLYLKLYNLKENNDLLIFQQLTNITTCKDNINKLVKVIIYFLNIPY